MQPDPTPTAPDAEAQTLLQAVNHARHALPWHLGFPPALEARMEADQDEQRRRQLKIAGLVALLVYDLFLVNDWLVRPEALGVAMWCRLGIVTGYGLFVLALVHRGLPARWREALMASTLVVAMAAAGEIFRHTRSPAGAYDPFVFGLVFMAGNIVFPLRFVPAVVSSALCVAVSVPFVRSNPLLPPTRSVLPLACWRARRSSRRWRVTGWSARRGCRTCWCCRKPCVRRRPSAWPNAMC